MKINKDILLHVTMALAAVLVLSLPPLIDSWSPVLKFQPMINTMEGTAKEQKEKMMTIAHALQGNAIFFLGASEVIWSTEEPHAIFNYFNEDLHIPTVAYGGVMVDSVIQYSLLSHFKSDLSSKTKLVLLLSPDSFFRAKVPPRIFEQNLPADIFDPLLQDSEVAPMLQSYLENTRGDKISHLSFSQMRIRGWYFVDVTKEGIYQFGSFCDLVRDFYKQIIHIKQAPSDIWPTTGSDSQIVDWDSQRLSAEKNNEYNNITAATHWMTPHYLSTHKTKFDWNDRPPASEQITAFKNLITLLHAKHVQVLAIVDPINPWAANHTERYKSADSIVKSILKDNQIPYYDMYEEPYQNGWNKDALHPTDLTWVDMDRFIYEHFK
jgi:D-alanine transfer protein